MLAEAAVQTLYLSRRRASGTLFRMSRQRGKNPFASLRWDNIAVELHFGWTGQRTLGLSSLCSGSLSLAVGDEARFEEQWFAGVQSQSDHHAGVYSSSLVELAPVRQRGLVPPRGVTVSDVRSPAPIPVDRLGTFLWT